MREGLAQEETVPLKELADLTDALAGAFADGVDLGPRGAQIRALGRSLETTIAALRKSLVGLGDATGKVETLAKLDGLNRMARAARTYGMIWVELIP